MHLPSPTSDKPRVSIGLPVYNGENYLRDALDSLLSQTFTDFELIISDNASTDATEKICREYLSKDSRIKYHRTETNIGGAANFNRVFELSQGEYFKWAAHDDKCAPEFLERCVEVLDQDPSVVVCFSRTRFIDEQGKFTSDYETILNTCSPKPHERFHNLINIRHQNYQIFGLIRASALRMTPLMGNYAIGDTVVLARLALFGRFHEIPEFLFFVRRHIQQSVIALWQPKHKHRRLHQYAEWYHPANKKKILLPNWRLLREYFISVGMAPLTWYEQVCCYLQVGRWLVTQGTIPKLGRDLILAAIQIVIRIRQLFSRPVQDLEIQEE